MEYKVESNSKTTQKFLESLMPSFIKQLGLQSSTKALLVKVTADTPEGMEGATLFMEVADCYLVLIKPPKKRINKVKLIDMATTLAHEMVHVRQLAKGMMKFLPNNARMWMGKRYNKRVTYLNQPWELDAFSKQEILVRRAIEE